MKVTLRDVIPAESVRAEVERLVSRLLDQTVTLDMRYEGVPSARREAPAEPIVCPDCGRDDFTTTSALGGHRFHKHGVRASS